MNAKDRALMASLLNTAGAAIEAAYEVIAKYEEETPCDHPTDKRVDFSTMGVKRWKCSLCGYVYEQGGE